ncbi:conjugative transposon protein TraK [Mucilaginibacter sp. RS28]|uniref:Conjugative transposon protein TraK n=1 Tax=Mucilaginibacter straminoryzae TaxID=2932774 RepID=A0A9X1X432_9SPHI|nr:conjugative transposon protein TraK [Mucilaginibacter straminoryzae]MCJ8208114.1 conjugative transposon protein TraK [Mucilaginibacter straminoryzae]
MFQQLKNIDTAFKHIKWFSIVLIIACAFISCYAIYKSYQSENDYRQHIYILANGKALEAFSADRNENIPVEARDHIATFHRDFFSLDPDDKVIEANLTKALYLADNSAAKVYSDLKEQGYYTNLISGNISQQLTVDSIAVDVSAYPYRFRFYGKEKMIRSTSIVTRSLVTEGQLRNVSRSDNNPHGFLIEKWATIENKDLAIQNR